MMQPIHKFILALVLLLLGYANSYGQTTIHGKMLSVDGRSIPKTLISVQHQNPRDIFSGYDDLHAEKDGSYKITILEPGMYNITFRGIYHQSATIPILVIDQNSIEMDLLLLPSMFNDGRYFGNDEYLEWIRVFGNFNNYDILAGIPFNLNDDGSISAFIPVTSDTIRYQVRGLGSATLPQADEYDIRTNSSFESVLYRNLPPDSIEIRYKPEETMPFKRLLPDNANQEQYNARGFISFKRHSDRYWVEPIHMIRFFGFNIPVIEQDLTSGLTPVEQIQYMERFFSEDTTDYLIEVKERIRKDFYKPEIHPQQKAMISLGYVAVLHQIEMLNRMMSQTNFNFTEIYGMGKPGQSSLESNSIDKEILLYIPKLVVPTHPVLRRTQMLSQYLLNITEGHPDIMNFYLEIAKHHSDEFAIEGVVTALVREQAHHYESVDQMEVYQIIVERFGEREIARRSHEAFRFAHQRGR